MTSYLVEASLQHLGELTYEAEKMTLLRVSYSSLSVTLQLCIMHLELSGEV